MTLHYEVFDVFTDRPLAGNSLAVVYDADDLPPERMQAIAAEFNLSETVFVMKPANPSHSAAIRIFMPRGELPFAGHPTVGAAVAIASRRYGTEDKLSALVVLEEKIGPVRCAVRREAKRSYAEFDVPKLPAQLGLDLDKAAIAAALGFGPHEIGFENHQISAWSAGVPYVCVPVCNLDAIGKAAVDPSLWLQIDLLGNGLHISPYLYCRETVHASAHFHARMFAPWDGIAEDPATGSAAAAFAGAVVTFDKPGNGLHAIRIEQGVEMGRPSFIDVAMDFAHGALAAARIGGHAVKIAAGSLLV